MTAGDGEDLRAPPAAEPDVPADVPPAAPANAQSDQPPQPEAAPTPKPEPPAPIFQSAWNGGEALARLGVAPEDVQLLDTVNRSFSRTWRKSYDLPDPVQGRRERERLAVAWVRVLLDVRARDLKRRMQRIALTPAAFDAWERVTRDLSTDLLAVGWRLAREEALAEARVAWHVPANMSGKSPGRRWLLPPLARDSELEGGAAAAGPVGRSELAEPVPAPSGWHASVLTVAWVMSAHSPGPARSIVRTLWNKAGEIDRRMADAALHGVDADLKHFIAEEYWEPLYLLVYLLAAQARLAPPGSGPDGDAWLRDLARQLAAAQLVVREVRSAEPGQLREATGGEPPDRPALLDAATGRLVSFGLSRGRTEGRASGSEGPGVTGVESNAGPVHAPAEPETRARRSPQDALPSLDAAPGPDPSAWHACVREVFAARRRMTHSASLGEAHRYRQLMDLAGRIDLRQRDFIVEPADDAFKSTVAEEYWAPLYSLAHRCFDLSQGTAGGNGAAWLARMRELLGMAQLRTVPAGPNSDPEWFREPAADEPPGRPAVLDLASRRVFSLGTRIKV